jgi:hypothetical protein
MWGQAAIRADAAYAQWALLGGRDRFVAYRAAADEADAAQDVLAEQASTRHRGHATPRAKRWRLFA